MESLPIDEQNRYYKVKKCIFLILVSDLILTKREENEIYSLPLQLACIVKQNVDSRKENYKQGDILFFYETL